MRPRKAKRASPRRVRAKGPTGKRAPPARRATARGGVAVAGNVACADFVGRDKVTHSYGFSPADVEHLIEKVLAFVQAGAAFIPHGSGDALRAELDGETLTFRAGAIAQLAAEGQERTHLLALTVKRDYQIWATKFIPLAARMDVKRVIECARDCGAPLPVGTVLPLERVLTVARVADVMRAFLDERRRALGDECVM